MAGRESVKELQAELEEAYDRIAELEVASGLDDFRKRAEGGVSRIIRLEEENTRLNRDNERLRDQVDSLTEQFSQADRELREERQSRQDASEALTRMKSNFERAEDQLTRERQRAADAAAAGARAVKDRQVHSVELEKYATENSELREELRVLNEDLLAYREAVAELKGDLEDAADDKVQGDVDMREAQVQLAKLRAEMEEARSAIERSATALEDRDNEIRNLRRELDASATRAAADLRGVREKLALAERSTTLATAELKSVKDSSRVKQLEDEVGQAKAVADAVRREMAAVLSQRDELSSELDAHNAQLEAAMREIRALQEDKDAAVAEAVDAAKVQGQVGAASRQATVAAAQGAVREERGRATEVQQQKAEVERDLEEARSRLAAYERGYGLEEAVREQERLRDALRRRDADIARLTRAAGSQLDAYDMAVEIAGRLAEKSGLARTVDVFKLYPELELRQGIDSTVERLRALNSELQRQNDALEDQRLKLLRQLRVHAENMGDKSLKYYGLSSEQLMLVNEFAENLRDGRVDLPVHDRTLEVQSELTKVRHALEEAQREVDLARAGAAPTAVSVQMASPSHAAAPAPSTSAPRNDSIVPMPMPAGLAATLAQLAEDNRKLRVAMEVSMASGAESKRRATAIRSASRAAMPAMAATGDGPVDDALSILRIKMEAEDTLDPEEMVQLARVIGRLVGSIKEASGRGSTDHDRVLSLQGAVDGLRSRAEHAERMLEAAREEMHELTQDNNELEKEQLEQLAAIRKQLTESTIMLSSKADQAGSVDSPVALTIQKQLAATTAHFEQAQARGEGKARAEASKREAALAKHLSDKASADKAMSLLQKELAIIKRDQSADKEAVERAQNDLRTALKDLKDTAQRYNAAATQAQVAQTTVDIVTPQLADLHRQLASSQAELANVKAENATLEKQVLEQLTSIKAQLSTAHVAMEGSVASSQNAMQRTAQLQLAATLKKLVEAVDGQISAAQSKTKTRSSSETEAHEIALTKQFADQSNAEQTIAVLQSEQAAARAQTDSLTTQLVESHKLLAAARAEVAELRKDNHELQKESLAQIDALGKQLAGLQSAVQSSLQASDGGVAVALASHEASLATSMQDAHRRMEAQMTADAKEQEQATALYSAYKSASDARADVLRAELASVRTAAGSEATQLRVQIDMLRSQAADAQREVTSAKAEMASLASSAATDAQILSVLASLKDSVSSALALAQDATLPAVEVVGVQGAAPETRLKAAVDATHVHLAEIQKALDGRMSSVLAAKEKATATTAFDRGEADKQVAGLRAQLSEVKAAAHIDAESLRYQLEDAKRELGVTSSALKLAQDSTVSLRVQVGNMERANADTLLSLKAQAQSIRAALETTGSGSAGAAASSAQSQQLALALSTQLQALQAGLANVVRHTETRAADASARESGLSAQLAEREATSKAMQGLREQLGGAQQRASTLQERLSRTEADLRAAMTELTDVKGKLSRAAGGASSGSVLNPWSKSGVQAAPLHALSESALVDEHVRDLGEPKSVVGPRTAGGAAALKLLRRSEPDGAPMEPEEWAAELNDARAAMVEALEELAVREDETGRFEALVREYAGKASAMIAQQTALYRAYIGEKAASETALAEAKEREAEAVARADALVSKAKRLDEITAVLDGGKPFSADIDSADALAYISAANAASAAGLPPVEAENRREEATRRLRDYVKALSRKLAAMEVAQPMLARKYNLLKAEAAAARAGQRSAELSAVEAETHLRSRILYLELWKKGAESRLERLAEVSTSWVPGDEHSKAVASLTALQAQHADLLSSEASLRVQYTELRGLPARLSAVQSVAAMCTAELESTRSALEAARDEAASARVAMTAAVATVTGAGTGLPDALSDPAAGLLSTASRPDLIVALTKQRAQLGDLEVQLAGASKKASLLSGRVAELEGAAEALQKRAHEAEDAALAARQASSRAEALKQEVLRAAGLNVDGSTPASGVESAAVREVKSALTAMKNERDSLSLELHKARGIADIACDQARAVEGLIKDRELEEDEMREGLRRLAARSDDDAIIGSLQHQLLTLKSSYHSFLRKHEAQKGALSRTRVAAAALEVGLDQRAGEVLAVREDGRVKVIALQRVLDDVRAQMRSLESAGSTLAQAASFSESVRRLASAADRQAGEVEDAVRARHSAEEACEGRAIECTSLTRTVEDLTAAAIASGGRAHGQGRGTEGRDVARRLVELNDALKQAQLAGLRQRRELALCRDEARLAKRRLEEYEAAVRGLEVKLVGADTEMRRKEDEYRRSTRVAVAAAVAQAGDASAIVAGSREGGVRGLHRTPPQAGQGAKSEEEQGVRMQQVEGALAEEKRAGRELREKARAAVERSRLRGRRITFLESQLTAAGLEPAVVADGFKEEDEALAAIIGGPSDADEEGGDENMAPGARLPPSGKRSTALVPRPIGTSGSAGPQGEVKEVYEEELKRLQKAAAATTASLKELLAKKNSVIAEYQGKLESIRREREGEKAAEVRERDKLVQAAYAENAVTIDKLKQSLKALQDGPASGSVSASAVVQQLHERAEDLEKALTERDRRIAELEMDKRSAAAHVHATPASPPSTPSRGSAVAAGELEAARRRVEDLERRLRDELGSRDRKLKSLQASFAALKEEFVRAEEAHAAALVHAQASAQAATARAGRANMGIGFGTPNRMGSSGAGLTASYGDDNGAGDSKAGEGVEDITALRDAALREKVGGLVEQVGRMGRDVKSLRAALVASEEDKGRLSGELDKVRTALSAARAVVGGSDGALAKLKADNAKLARDLEGTKSSMSSKLAEAMAQGARSAADGTLAALTGGGDGGATDALMRKVKVLEAQVAALRSAQAEASLSSSGSPHPGVSFDGHSRVPPPRAPESGATGSTVPSSALNAGAAIADARMAWENERKLRKRIDALQSKLGEKAKECEGLKSGEEALTAAVSRLKAERDALDKRVQALIKRQGQLDAATNAAMAHIVPVSDLKQKLFDVQEELASVKRRSELELTLSVKRAETDAQEARMMAEGAASDAAEMRTRLWQMQASDVKEGKKKEDIYAAEFELRERLSEARRAVAGLEGTVLSKDAVILEARLEAEASRQAEDRVRTRLAEVLAFSTIMGNSKGSNTQGGTPASGTTSAKAGVGRSKREEELEDLTAALKRVTDNQRTEIDRLRKQLVAAGNARDSALAAASSAASASTQASAVRELADREANGGLGSRSGKDETLSLAQKSSEEAAELLKQLRSARAEVARLKDKVNALEAPLPSDPKGVETLRRAAATAEAEFKNLKAKYAALERSHTALSGEVSALRDIEKHTSARAAAMEKRLKETGEAAFVPPPVHVQASAGNSSVNTSLQVQLADPASSAAAVLQTGNSSGSKAGSPVRATADTRGGAAGLSTRMQALEAENAELKAELTAFDLNFFEEIEDLKYKYAEAAKKCRAFDEYVRLYPPVHGAPPMGTA